MGVGETTEAVGVHRETITEEALRKCAIIESIDYEFPERVNRLDLVIGIVVCAISLFVMWIGALV